MIDILKEWKKIQNELKSKLVLADTIDPTIINLIGGVDISFIKDDDHPDGPRACAGLVIYELKNKAIVYQHLEIVHMKQPYIAGFLAFREVDFLINLIEKAKMNGYIPDVIMVDGNGILHPHGFGLACHLGVLTKIPTIGIAKNLHIIDGLCVNTIKDKFRKECTKKGEYVLLRGKSGIVLGAVIKSARKSTNPIYVSIGNGLSLDTCLQIVNSVCEYRIPEPVRHADLKTRAYLRIKFPN